jgi:lysine/ornithine N-monooxygenase
MPTSTAVTKLQTDLLIIGAGPFGISLAAHAQQNDLDYLMVGVPMEFWKQNMPEGMYLRSACDWHLDADGEHTIESFLAQQQLTPEAVEPLSLEFYLSYVQWFLAQKQLKNLPVYVQQLDRKSDGSFMTLLQDGSLVEAQRVAIAVGFKYFVNLPEELTSLLPIGHYVHTCDFVELNQLEGKSCLILGGRQSAFEWAALLAEAEARAIHLAYRHETPAFVEADWSWVNTIVDEMGDNPGWYRHLSDAEKKEVSYRLWAEGRLKLEPWLKDRITNEQVHLWPQSQVTSTTLLPNGKVLVTLDSGVELEVDQIILATGYKAAVERIPFLQKGNLLPQLAIQDGFPELDETFQTNIPGLYITSLPAGRDFGPFFGFTVAVRVATKLIGRGLLQRQFA